MEAHREASCRAGVADLEGKRCILSRLIEVLGRDAVIHDTEIQTFHRYQIAVVVLLVEASQIDRVVTAGEREAIIRIVRERFGLVGEAALRLIALAEVSCSTIVRGVL